MRHLHVKEYKDYLKAMQGSIHKILPLYEDMEKHLVGLNPNDSVPKPYVIIRGNLVEYINDLYDEVKHVLNIIEVMPHGAWYPSTEAGLLILAKEVIKDNNHKKVKKKVMHLTGLIQKQIESLGV